ncbi:MAG: hypothetical protein M0R66_03490 [Candidatus Omnitrophica bacterium]|nr:hypothetical protein [Candidatus Omnitrophota bacterium]
MTATRALNRERGRLVAAARLHFADESLTFAAFFAPERAGRLEIYFLLAPQLYFCALVAQYARAKRAKVNVRDATRMDHRGSVRGGQCVTCAREDCGYNLALRIAQ